MLKALLSQIKHLAYHWSDRVDVEVRVVLVHMHEAGGDAELVFGRESLVVVIFQVDYKSMLIL